MVYFTFKNRISPEESPTMILPLYDTVTEIGVAAMETEPVEAPWTSQTRTTLSRPVVQSLPSRAKQAVNTPFGSSP